MKRMAKVVQPALPTNRAIGYYRVSTDDQNVAPQRDAVGALANYKGWDLVAEFEDEGISGSKEAREGLDAALELLRTDQADILAVAKLDRLSRSAHHFLSLMKQAKEEGWDIAIKELDLDTSTPIGKAVLTILAAVAELEVEMIRARTKSALAAKKQRGIVGGRRPVAADLAQRITELRAADFTLQQIADQLNADGVATPQGGAEWRPSSVRSVLQRTAA